jgi:16S rRNA (guanine527-N7)-methyltransferase
MTVQTPLTIDPLELLQEGAAALKLDLAPATVEQFRFYLTQLKLWNQRVNLTGLKTDRDMVIKHFLDSLAVLPFLGPVPASPAWP